MQLGRIKRFACLGITGAIKSTPYCSNGGAPEYESAESTDHG
jgi:hypothetical protein